MGSLISGIGGLFGDSPQAQAAQTQANSQKAANQQNYQMFEQSRGQGGSAVLPTYLTNPNGSLFEGSLGSDLISGYNQTNIPLSTFQSATDKTAPAQAGANQFTNDIFNGNITNKLLAEAQPTEQARTNSAADALNKTLADIDAAQSGKGFSGDSYGNRVMQMQGRQAQGNAGVQNLAENQQIQNYGDVTLPMQNINLPYTMSQSNNQLAFMPQNDYLSSIQSRMTPFNFLKLGQGTPPAVQPLPTAPPSSTLANFGGAANTALNYYLQGQGGGQGGGSAWASGTPYGGGVTDPGASYWNSAPTVGAAASVGAADNAAAGGFDGSMMGGESSAGLAALGGG